MIASDMEFIEDDFIDELLIPEPIVFYEKEMTCVNRGCRSPTHIMIENIPRCMMHTIHRCNELLKEYYNREEPEISSVGSPGLEILKWRGKIYEESRRGF